jgi:hypothetical protein
MANSTAKINYKLIKNNIKVQKKLTQPFRLNKKNVTCFINLLNGGAFNRKDIVKEPRTGRNIYSFIYTENNNESLECGILLYNSVRFSK